MIAKGIIFLIKAYQLLAKCFAIRTCRFYPSCSYYTVESIEKYGALKGSIKGFNRILRCSPISLGGYDPVR